MPFLSKLEIKYFLMRTFFLVSRDKIVLLFIQRKKLLKNSQKNPEYRTNLPDQQKNVLKSPYHEDSVVVHMEREGSETEQKI